MSSVSSVRSAASAWITSSSSTNVTCAACCRAIFSIIMTPERTSRSTRIVRGLVLYSFPPQAKSSLSPRWVDYITVMTVARHEVASPHASCPITLNSFLSKHSEKDRLRGAGQLRERAPGRVSREARASPHPLRRHGYRLGAQVLLRVEWRRSSCLTKQRQSRSQPAAD